MADPGPVRFPVPQTLPPSRNAANHDEVWSRFKTFYSKNEKTLEKCIKTDVKAIARGDKVSDIEQQIDSFSETTKIVMDGLAELGKIHPIIGAAVVAFHAVISLDLARRENDRKVIAIMVEMQNMMCAMFQLRHLTHDHVNEEEKEEEKKRLAALVKAITDDITQCGSDINYYLSQKFVLKMAKAWNFEARFKTHVAVFATRRSELQTAIASYIAGGIDHANLTLVAVSAKMDAIDDKLDVIFEALLRKLDTPSEKETQAFFDANGGVKNCVTQDDLLARLLALAGDVVLENETEKRSEDKMSKSRRILLEELQKDFNESLKQNTLRFEKLLVVQSNNHERVIAQLEKQEGYQKVAASKLDKLLFYMHPETKLNDPELRRIWDDMGLKTSVKAKNFVLTFRDHYQQAKSAPPSAHPLNTEMPTGVARQAGQSLTVITGLEDHSPGEDPDAWLLEYIDVAHVRPIIEAMDADNSGFISVKEINAFARSRPNQWSLLQWMVYWAAGWHINVLSYRDKIYDILIKMHELLPLIHPANQRYVDRYVDSFSMHDIEGLLRSTKELSGDKQSAQLKELAVFYADIQETALKTNLQEVSYVISSAADAALVAGAARVESWIYPILYLLLDRHLAILKLAKTHILNDKEMLTHETSLHSALSVFHQRREVLQAIFSQIYHNVGARFETFAYGMFYASHKPTEIVTAKATLLKMRTKATRQNILLSSATKTAEHDIQPDLSILAHEKAPSPAFNLINLQPPNQSSNNTQTDKHPLSGYWAGLSLLSDGQVLAATGLYHFILSVAPDGTLAATAESCGGPLELNGRAHRDPANALSYNVELEMPYGYGPAASLMSFKGVYDAERDTIRGEYVTRKRPSPSDSTNSQPSSLNLARKRWILVIEAVRREVRVKQLAAKLHRQGVEQMDVGEQRAEIPQDDITHRGRFYMVRTPAEVFRFRTHLTSEDRDSLSMARRRWIFATEAVRYNIRARHFTWEFIRTKFAERKLWVRLIIRYLRAPMSAADIDLFCQIVGSYHPAEGYIHNVVAYFLDQRLYAYVMGRYVTCDYCGNHIILNRYWCITCMKEDLEDEIDLCVDDPECIASPCTNTRNNFIHTPSHTLLRSNYFIHGCELPALISMCRARSDNIKKRYRAIEEGKKATRRSAKSLKVGQPAEGVQRNEESSKVEPMTCVCCAAQVSLPCWICALCAIDTVICFECERARANIQPGKSGSKSLLHSHNHLLLRINDNKEIHSGEINNARLQQELSIITADLRSLELKVTSHLRSADKVASMLKALAEANPTIVPLDRASRDRYDELSDIFSDDLSQADGRLSAPLSPNAFAPSILPLTSEAPDKPTIPVKKCPESTLEPHSDGISAVREDHNSTLAGGEPPIVSVSTPSTSFVMDTPTQPRAQFLDAPASSRNHAAPTASEQETTPISSELVGIHGNHSRLRQVVDSRLDSLDKRVSELEKTVDMRFSGLEKQMGEMLILLRNMNS